MMQGQGQKTPKYTLKFDQEACGNAVLCLKCVHACRDHGVNCICFVNKATPPVGEGAPKDLKDIDHKVGAPFAIFCDGCGKCVEVCPKNAITLVKPEFRDPATRVSFGDLVYCHTLRDGTKVYPRGHEPKQ